MNSLDWIVFVLILISTLVGFFRGIVTELLKLGTLSLAVWVGLRFRKTFSSLFLFIKVQEIREIITGILIFIIVFIIGSIINFLISEMVNAKGISKFINKLLGMAYGVLRGLAIIIITIAILEKNSMVVHNDLWQKSCSLGEIKKISVKLYSLLPKNWQKQLEQL